MTPNDYIEKVIDKGESDINNLSFEEKTVYIIANADSEISINGVYGYLSNSSGNDIEFLIKAFNEIGCPRLSKLTKDIVTLLTRSCTPTDRHDRQKVLNSPSADLEVALESFENAFQKHVEDYGGLLEQYIKKIVK